MENIAHAFYVEIFTRYTPLWITTVIVPLPKKNDFSIVITEESYYYAYCCKDIQQDTVDKNQKPCRSYYKA